MGRGAPLVRYRRGRRIVRLGRGNNKSTNAPKFPILEVLSTGGAKNPNRSKDVLHPQVPSRYLSVEDRVNNCPKKPPSTDCNAFAVTVHNLREILENKWEESEKELNEYKKEFRTL